MVVQVREIHPVGVSWSFNLKNVEVNRVMVRKRKQHALDPLVLQNGGQVLIGFYELDRKLVSEMCTRNRLQLIDRHISNTFMQKD